MLTMVIFRYLKTKFPKSVLIPGEKDTRNEYSKFCRNKTSNCCSVFFFLCWPVQSIIRANFYLFRLNNDDFSDFSS